jgi:pimeloyl-ACP methyl ester carboxylesterase
VALIASSMGAFTGLWYSTLHPEELVAGLYISPVLGLEHGLAEWAGEEGLRQWQGSGTITVANEMGSWELGWCFMDDLISYHEERLMELYRTPCLILQGQQDDRVDWARVQDFASQCPFRDIEFHLFADGDHRLGDRKQRLWDLMLAFLRGRGLLPSSPL